MSFGGLWFLGTGSILSCDIYEHEVLGSVLPYFHGCWVCHDVGDLCLLSLSVLLEA